MQVTESLITDTPEEIHITKFMPELVSVDELLMLADSYKASIETLAATLHQHDKGSEQHLILTDEMGGACAPSPFSHSDSTPAPEAGTGICPGEAEG